MPTLPTYQSTAQLQQVQQPNIGRQYGVGDVLGSIGQEMNRIELADRKNKIDDATIQTKKGLALRQASFLEDPLADEEAYKEDMGQIVQSGSDILGDVEDRRIFSRDMGLTTALLGIEATSARTTAITVRGKENSYTKLKEQQSMPPALRPQLIKQNLDEAQAAGYFDQKGRDILESGANVNNAIYDAKDAKSAKQVMAIVSDEKFDNSTYKLTNDERKSVYAEAKNLHDMYVIGDEFDSLSKDDQYANKVAVIMASNVPQAMKSRKIFDAGVMLGISGPTRGMAQAELASKVGVQPSGTTSNANALFMKIENIKDSKPQNNEEAMAFLKRDRETFDELVDSYKTGKIGHPEFIRLTKKFGVDLTDAKAFAMGQVQEMDDVPFDVPFFGEDYKGSHSYENAYKDFSTEISNTSMRADFFNEYTKIVERMEDTDKVPPYVDKKKDKWGRRKDVQKQMFAQYAASKTPRARETLNSATRSIAPQYDNELIDRAIKETGASKESLTKRLGKGNFGLRHDKSGYKGLGFLGDLRDSKGVHMTEFSLGTEIGGKAMEIPSIVPTLTKDEIRTIVDDKTTTEAINKKAFRYAEKRVAEGKSVWASDADRKKEIIKRTKSSDEEVRDIMKRDDRTEEEVLDALMKSYLKEK